LGDGSWKLEVGRWEMGDGRGKLEVGSWKMGDGRWEILVQIENSKFQLIKIGIWNFSIGILFLILWQENLCHHATGTSTSAGFDGV
jgi:hypothetical protein